MAALTVPLGKVTQSGSLRANSLLLAQESAKCTVEAFTPHIIRGFEEKFFWVREVFILFPLTIFTLFM